MRDLLEKQLKIINDAVELNYLKVREVGAHKGLAGLSLFKFYNLKYKENEIHRKAGHEILTQCAAEIDNDCTDFYFCDGASGFGWVLDHLEQQKFIESDNDAFLSQFDQQIFSAMVRSLSIANYDFLYGAIGNALYFLNRYKNTKEIRLREKYEAVLLEFIFLLDKISVKEQDRTKWFYVLTESESINCSLGLCHGMSSIIAFLSKLHGFDKFKEKTAPLLQNSVNYLISFKNENADAFSLFPNFSNNSPDSLKRSRLGWCYGDLGIGITLLRAAKEMGDSGLNQLALSVLKHASKRRTPEQTLIEGTSICHGIYGAAKIFHKAHLMTGETVFREAAEYWFQEGLNATICKNGRLDAESWKSSLKNFTLLDGACGIGLVILDYLTGIDSGWDECLLLN